MSSWLLVLASSRQYKFFARTRLIYSHKRTVSELVTLAFHIKGANLTFELKLYQNVHYKCPASASHGIENIMAAPNLSSSDEGVGGLGMSFVGQPNRRWRSLKPCRIFSTDLPISSSSLGRCHYIAY